MQAYYSIIEGIPMDILIHSCSHSVDRGKKKKKKKKHGFEQDVNDLKLILGWNCF